MYKIKMKVAVIIEITAKETSEAFQLLELSKKELLYNETKNCKVLDVYTDLLLKEEIFP